MDSELAVLTAIALALTLQLRSHPPEIPATTVNWVEAQMPLCQQLEFGMPCVSMEVPDTETAAAP